MRPYCEFPLCFINEAHFHAEHQTIGGEPRGLTADLKILEEMPAMKFKALPPPIPRHVERRRYALLQAAATLMAGCLTHGETDCMPEIDDHVDTAERLLEIIECREEIREDEK